MKIEKFKRLVTRMENNGELEAVEHIAARLPLGFRKWRKEDQILFVRAQLFLVCFAQTVAGIKDSEL